MTVDQLDEEREKRLKLEGALEMAGATAEELNRPLTIIQFLLDSLLKESDVHDPKQPYLKLISEQLYQIAELARRINNVWTYETKEAGNGRSVIDLNKSVSPCVERDRISYSGEYWKLSAELKTKLGRT